MLMFRSNTSNIHYKKKLLISEDQCFDEIFK